MKHLIGINDLSVKEIDDLISLANSIIQNPQNYQNALRGKILATLFFEPSTRTRLSFESAFLQLGGQVIGFSSADASSTSKGESLADTIRTVTNYSNIIVMRHPKEGAALRASEYAGVPIINAGDGGNQHPTQTLTDLLTISKTKGTLENLTIAICGDLKYGRTVHSLIKAMTRYKGTKFVLISPDELKIPDYLRNELINKNLEFSEVTDLENSLVNADILYMTRIQRERFADLNEYERLKNSYILDLEKLKNAKEDLQILHPLPRVNEIAPEVDNDPRAVYFDQTLYGKYIRMALMLKSLQNTDKIIKSDDNLKTDHLCTNDRCITSIENGITHKFEVIGSEQKTYRCIYCHKEYTKN